jgi:hypothetical protein
MNLDRAAAIGLFGLAFLTAREDPLGRFLSLSGIDPAELKGRADDLGMLAAVLEFLLSDDEMVKDFCREQNVSPPKLHLAQYVLENRPL